MHQFKFTFVFFKNLTALSIILKLLIPVLIKVYLRLFEISFKNFSSIIIADATFDILSQNDLKILDFPNPMQMQTNQYLIFYNTYQFQYIHLY